MQNNNEHSISESSEHNQQNNNNNSLSTMGHTTTATVTTPSGGISSAISSAPNPISATGATKECAGCSKRITERYLLKALDLFWHEDCLKCGCCDCRLGEVGSTLYTKANLLLCKRDYLRLFGTTGYCSACNKVIPAFEMVMRAKNNVYHLECFACQQCNHRFCVGDRFYLCDNKILCEYDYEERLVFANMAYNPSSLAHIRRQVNNLQPAEESLANGRLANLPRQGFIPEKIPQQQQQQQQQQHHHHQHLAAVPPQPHPPNIGGGGPPVQQHRDDGSSGYGSPDSETFETPIPQQ